MRFNTNKSLEAKFFNFVEDIIKTERKKAKKINEDYKVIFWIPDNKTITVDLLADNEKNLVDFGTLVTFEHIALLLRR